MKLSETEGNRGGLWAGGFEVKSQEVVVKECGIGIVKALGTVLVVGR